MASRKTKLSGFLSLVLRHKPEEAYITLDEEGFVDTTELLNGINKTGRSIDYQTLKEIVVSDNKGRYSFSNDGLKIRANQGHSIQVDVGLKESIPPNVLYHGTAKKYLQSILKNGIQSRNRLYVHLSDELEVAEQVGKRHGELVILEVDTQHMISDGFRFYISANGVWQCDFVPIEYLAIHKHIH